MKKWFFILLVVIASSQVSAQALHALLFINEREPGREVDRTEDMKNMAAFFEGIARGLGYEYKPSKNSDNNFTAARVNQVINSLRVEEEDIVVFYYSGHGHNEGKNKWPTLDLKDKNYWLSDILALLHEKCDNAKLILSIADCCNNGLSNARFPPQTFNPISNVNIKKLFTGFLDKQTIIMSASKQGEFSWSDTKRGALFGICLRTAINNHTSNAVADPTWKNVMDEAIKSTESVSGNRQTPQYDVIIRGSPIFKR